MANFQHGSYQHKKLFCELLTEHPVSPLTLPALEPETKQRLAELEIWPWVYGQHQRWGSVAQSFSSMEKGTLLQTAIAQMADNELALAQTLKTLCKKNRLGVLVVGNGTAASATMFRQCNYQGHLNFFLACGLYEVFQQAGYLQSDLLQVWDQMLNIQARHVLFFFNWLAYQSHVQQKPDYELTGLGSLWTLRSQWWGIVNKFNRSEYCLLYTSPSPRDLSTSRMPSSA